MNSVIAMLMVALSADSMATGADLANSIAIMTPVPSADGSTVWQRVDLAEGTPSAAVKKVYEALQFLQNFTEDDGPENELDHRFLGNSPARFFSDRIQTIYMDGASGKCAAYTMAYVGATKTRSLHICDFATVFSPLILSATLLHESRHTEGDGYQHTFCKHGELAGDFACDGAYVDGGSYGVEEEFLIRVSRSSKMNAEVREEARAQAVSHLLNRFNQPTLGERPGLLLLSDAGELIFYDGSQATTLRAHIPDSQIFVSRDLPTFFDRASGEVKTFYGNEHLIDAKGPVAAGFRLRSRDERLSTVDIAPVPNGTCFLTAAVLHCEDGKDVVNLDLPANFQPVQFLNVYIGGYRQIFISGANGARYLLPTDKKLSLWTSDQLVSDDTPALNSMRALVELDDSSKFSLSNEGVVMVPMETPGLWQPLPALEHLKFKRLLGPFYYSPRVTDL